IVRGFYLADSEATAWAEWYRHGAELGVPPQSRLPRVMRRFEVDLDEVADLTAADAVPQMKPTRRQWRITQPIGENHWKEGRLGLLVPSAAHADSRVLVVFRPTDDPPLGIAPLARPKRYDELPPLPTGLRT
ncbi:MAG: RES family NAD+ phosphorylase, partial [Chloroflexota bacterium]